MSSTLSLLQYNHNIIETILSYIQTAKTIDGTKYTSIIKALIDDEGNAYTYAPASDEIDSIVTTAAKSTDYIKFGNGFIVQWGTASVSSTYCSITFPTAFSSTNYMTLLTDVTTGSATSIANYGLGICTYYNTTTGTRAITSSSNVSVFCWMAAGF